MSCNPAVLAMAGVIVLAATGDVDVRQTRRARLESMSAEQKRTLADNLTRFQELPETEQANLQRLERDLSRDEQGARLREIMLRYHAWLKALPSEQRIELLTLPPEDRVAQIKELVENQERERFRDNLSARLQFEDQRALRYWLSTVVAPREAELLQTLPAEDRELIAGVEDDMRRRMMLLGMHRLSGESRLFDILKPSREQIDELSQSLSGEARQALDATRDATERRNLLQAWVRASLESIRQRRLDPREMFRFLREELTDEDRERLESLPPERMRWELQQLYWKYRGGFPGGPGPGRGGPPGFRGGGGPRGEGGRRPGEGPPRFGPGRPPQE